MAFSFQAATMAARFTLLAAVLLTACATGSGAPVPEDKPQPDSPPALSPFVTAHGSSLFVNGAPFSFRAVNFSNGYRESGHEVAAGVHHTSADFERVHQLGFNAIRFAFNGYWFERDREGFFRWLDSNITSAQQHELKLILALHVPIGGFWLDPASEDLDFSLWTDAALRERNVVLWQAIAERYHDEPTVAGYDLLNEPVTVDETGSQWQAFATQLATAIREYDPHHLVIVERLYGIRGHYGAHGQQTRFLIEDDNVLYDSHFYDPSDYTQASAIWRTAHLYDRGVYPDENALIPTGAHKVDAEARISSERIAPGTTDWRPYSSPWVVAKSKRLVAAAPQAAIHGALSGAVFFDDIRVFERDAAGTEREIISDSISDDTLAQWHDWQNKTAGSTLTANRVNQDGSNDTTSLATRLRGTGLNTTAGWSNNYHWFRVTPGNAYRIEGSMRGENVRYISNASDTRVGFELNFFQPDSDSDLPVFHARNRAYLEHALKPLADFSRRHAVPVSVLETGIGGAAFGQSGRGGEAWLQDVLSVLGQQNTSYGFWNYHDANTGIYQSHYLAPVGQANRSLINALLESQTQGSLSAQATID